MNLFNGIALSLGLLFSPTQEEIIDETNIEEVIEQENESSILNEVKDFSYYVWNDILLPVIVTLGISTTTGFVLAILNVIKNKVNSESNKKEIEKLRLNNDEMKTLVSNIVEISANIIEVIKNNQSSNDEKISKLNDIVSGLSIDINNMNNNVSNVAKINPAITALANIELKLAELDKNCVSSGTTKEIAILKEYLDSINKEGA